MVTREQRRRNLRVPERAVDVVLDTDTYNEIDDQFAVAYMLRSKEKLRVQAIYAAPFYNEKSQGPGDGMEKSYREIQKLLELMGESCDVYKGAEQYLPDEKTPVESPAARDLAARAKDYSPENPLYVIAIGAITNVASAVLLEPQIADNIVVVWLGGHGLHYHDTAEFNMRQDVAAARVVMGCGAPFVQLPCMGVVSGFPISKPELEYWFVGKNSISDYLAKNTIKEAESYASEKPWTRVIWDVTAVAWLLNDHGQFMASRIIGTHLPGYDNVYETADNGMEMCYVYHIHRDCLWEDVIQKITAG